jgi:glycosyltransferase involved in cell wall biosynthesis
VKTEKPAVTVVMPLYNKEAEVRRAVESVLSQTIQDFELIIVNDGSTDNGPEIVRNINDPRIRLLDQENAGVSAARNRGIEEARSDLIAFLDADDEWKSSFLETILNLKEKFPTCSVFATNYLYREANGKYRLPIIRGIPLHPWEGILEDYFGVAVKSDPPLWTSAVAVKKNALQSVGLFPIGVTSGEDLLTWAKLALKYKIAYSTKNCAIFYVPGSVFDRPGRFKDTTDFVGNELVRLFDDVNPAEAEVFKKYIALWHKNRVVSFLDLGEHQNAMKELRLMARYSGKTKKWHLYNFLSISPKRFTRCLMKGLRTVSSFRRVVSPPNR